MRRDTQGWSMQQLAQMHQMQLPWICHALAPQLGQKCQVGRHRRQGTPDRGEECESYVQTLKLLTQKLTLAQKAVRACARGTKKTLECSHSAPLSSPSYQRISNPRPTRFLCIALSNLLRRMADTVFKMPPYWRTRPPSSGLADRAILGGARKQYHSLQEHWVWVYVVFAVFMWVECLQEQEIRICLWTTIEYEII